MSISNCTRLGSLGNLFSEFSFRDIAQPNSPLYLVIQIPNGVGTTAAGVALTAADVVSGKGVNQWRVISNTVDATPTVTINNIGSDRFCGRFLAIQGAIASGSICCRFD